MIIWLAVLGMAVLSLAFQMPVLNQTELFDISHQLPFSDFQAEAQSSIGNKPVDLFELITEYCIMTLYPKKVSCLG